MQELYRHYGVELMEKVTGEMLDHTASLLRRRLLEVPDGIWRAQGNIEAGDKLWKMQVQLTKERDLLSFDFTGTDPQAPVGINLPYHATVGACFESLLQTLGYDLPKNHGLFRVMEVIAPEGTIVNPTYPAPVSLNTTSGGAVTRFLAGSTLIQMIGTSEKWSREVTAQTLGTRLARHAGVNQTGGYYVSTLVGLGGIGARSWGDGINTAGIEMGRPSTVHNVEWVEANFPLLYLYRRHLQDGAGAGKYRGGAGEESLLMTHDAPEAKLQIVALGVAGLRNSGFGIYGGHPGAPSILVHVEDSDVRKAVAAKTLPDELLYLRCANGGGYGDPLERNPEDVQQDVIDGLVSPKAAESIYGVVLADGQGVDADATQEKRKALGRERHAAVTRAPDESEALVAGTDTVQHPLQESLDVCDVDGQSWVRCSRCGYVLCGSDKDWRDACALGDAPPTEAGPLLDLLAGQYVFQRWYCPGCSVLLDSEIAAAEPQAG